MKNTHTSTSLSASTHTSTSLGGTRAKLSFEKKILMVIIGALMMVAAMAQSSQLDRLKVKNSLEHPQYSSLANATAAGSKAGNFVYVYSGEDTGVYVRHFDNSRWLKVSGFGNLESVNMANADLTLIGNRIHSLSGYQWRIQENGFFGMSYRKNRFLAGNENDALNARTGIESNGDYIDLLAVKYGGLGASFFSMHGDSVRIETKEIKLGNDYETIYQKIASTTANKDLMVIDKATSTLERLDFGLLPSRASYNQGNGIKIVGDSLIRLADTLENTLLTIPSGIAFRNYIEPSNSNSFIVWLNVDESINDYVNFSANPGTSYSSSNFNVSTSSRQLDDFFDFTGYSNFSNIYTEAGYLGLSVSTNDGTYKNSKFILQNGAVKIESGYSSEDSIYFNSFNPNPPYTPIAYKNISASTSNCNIALMNSYTGSLSLVSPQIIKRQTSGTPSGTADTQGEVGDILFDDNYQYIKTSAGWKRVSLASW